MHQRRLVLVEVKDPAYVAQKRGELSDFKLPFRRLAANTLNLDKNSFNIDQGYQVHHIVPLGLGGTNDPDNLVLVPEQLHSQIHFRIGAAALQAGLRQVGDKAEIELPFPVHPMVWNIEDFDATYEAIEQEKARRRTYALFQKVTTTTSLAC